MKTPCFSSKIKAQFTKCGFHDKCIASVVINGCQIYEKNTKIKLHLPQLKKKQNTLYHYNNLDLSDDQCICFSCDFM